MKRKLISILTVCIISVTAHAQSSEIFKTADGAIRGYDPVSYFKGGTPVKGKDDFKYTWNGADWHFSSQNNLDSFMANPDRFAPAFGGYCAYGMAGGHKAPTDPEAWTIVDGKLYFNYNKQVLGMWRKDQPGYINKANKNWPAIKDKQ